MIKVFGPSLSPYVRKVLVAAEEKGIAVDSIPVAIGSTDPEYLAASPFRKFPAISDGDFKISDSSAIVAYFEAIKPEPALIPSEPKARARTIWFDEFADTILFSCGAKLFFNRVVSPKFLGKPGDLSLADKAEAEELPPLLAYLESQIPVSNFLVDDRLTLADISIASVFVNLDHCSDGIMADTYPKLVEYLMKMLARPSFAKLIAGEKAFLAKAA